MSILSNIAAYWKLDESSGNAVDSTGNGNTLTNNNSAAFDPGLINNGIDLGSANTAQSLTTTGSLGINGGAISVSIWVKLRTEISSGEYDLFDQANNTSHVDYFVSYEYNGGSRQLNFHRAKPGISDQQFTYAVTLGTSAFHHIVLTYDGTTLTGYLDGAAVGSMSASGSGTAAISTGFGVGLRYISMSGFSSARMDECGVWSRALTSGEVNQLYNSGNGVQYPFPYSLAAAAGSYSMTGYAASLVHGRMRTLAAAAGSYAMTGYAAAMSLTGSVKWSNRAKNAASWSNRAKNAASWSNRPKSRETI